MIRKLVLSFAAVSRIPIAGYAGTTKALLIVLALGSTAIAQSHVIVTKFPTGRVCNLETDISISDSTAYTGRGLVPWINSDDAATHNLAVMNAAFDRVGHGSGLFGFITDDPEAIYDPLYVPGRTYYCRPGWVIARVGGQLLTGGGLQYDAFEGWRGVGLASLTKFVFVGGSNSTPCINYETYGWKIGLINFWAVPENTTADSTALQAGTLGAKRSICFEVGGGFTACGGLRCEGMNFVGFTDCVHFSASVINGDRCHWDYLGMRYCNNLIHCENEQSVFDSVGHAEAYSGFDYMFKFDHGGDFTVTDSCSIEGGGGDGLPSGGTVLYVGQGSANMPRFTIHGLGVDNTALWAGSMKMVEFGNSLDYAAVRIDGKYDYDYSRGHDLTGGNSDDYDSGVSPIKINSVTGGNDGIHYSVHLDVTGISPTTAAAYPR